MQVMIVKNLLGSWWWVEYNGVWGCAEKRCKRNSSGLLCDPPLQHIHYDFPAFIHKVLFHEKFKNAANHPRGYLSIYYVQGIIKGTKHCQAGLWSQWVYHPTREVSHKGNYNARPQRMPQGKETYDPISGRVWSWKTLTHCSLWSQTQSHKFILSINYILQPTMGQNNILAMRK